MNKNQLSAFLQKGNRTTWCVFLLFAFSIFLKCTLFHWLCYHCLLISSLWKAPSTFFSFWLSKLSVAVFLASFVFLSKKQWWTIILSFIFDIWIIADLIYFRANGLHLSIDVMFMVNNMQGFWSSILAYLDGIYCFPLISTIYLCLIFPYCKTQSTWRGFCLTFGLAVLLHIVTVSCQLSNKFNLTSFIPCWTNDLLETNIDNISQKDLNSSSIVSLLPTIIVDKIRLMNYYNISYSPTEQTFLQIIQDKRQGIDSIQIHPQNMILILVESLESWPFEFEIEEITPNFSAVKNNAHSLYAHRITSQKKYGMSGDGQMIIQTGLLPISHGVACMLFPNNVYPNFGIFYDKSLLLNPNTAEVWNQELMRIAYNYKDALHAPADIKYWKDKDIFQQLIDACFATRNMGNSKLYCAITLNTHTPFDNIPLQRYQLPLDSDMPLTMQKYLTCLHYTDSCFGVFWDKFSQSKIADSTIVVITGDHTIFQPDQLREFIPFAKEHNLSIQNGKNYCPLIIYSPSITEPIRIEDVCYQMDIYPTILSLIGAEDYYWKGFGVNLSDSAARQNRPISEEEAYILSDKLIRSNWFANRK